MEDRLQMLGKIPPHDLEAEQSAIGSMLLDKEAIVMASEMLEPDDFYQNSNKEIYSAVLSLYAKNEPVDLITLSAELKKRDLLEVIGGINYLSDLVDGVVTTANMKAYCEIVEEKSILRRLIKASDQIIAEGYRDSENIDTIIELAEKNIFDITQKKSNDGFSHIKEILLLSLENIEKMAASGGEITGLTTGFIDLDRMTSGLQRSDLVLLAARPSMGKTALGVNIVQNSALKGGYKCAIFSLEMSKEQLVQRMLSSESNVELRKILTGELDEEEWSRLASAMGPLSQAGVYIDDTPGITLNELRAKCRRLKIESGLDIVLIDYLQLMSGGGGSSDNRQQEISEISRGLKGLAREIQCPVIALSQLSRAPEQRADHRPIMSDLRESGAIEQDADIVMMLYRDEYYHPDSEDKNIGELIITKQRNGPTGTIKLAWMGQFTKYLNLELPGS
jgi:replicative DNA helicase